MTERWPGACSTPGSNACSIAADRQLPLAGLPLIRRGRRRHQAWQGERVEPAPVESLVAAFDLRAALQPQAPALLDAHGGLDFATLRARGKAVASAAGCRRAASQAVAVMTGHAARRSSPCSG